MICRKCGNVIEDNAKTCKFCGADTSAYIRTAQAPSQEAKSYEQIMQNRIVRDNPAPAPQQKESLRARANRNTAEAKEQPAREKPKKEREEAPKAPKAPKAQKAPAMTGESGVAVSGGGNMLSLIASVVAAVLSLICLISVSSMKSSMAKIDKSTINALQTIANQNAEIVTRLDTLDGTVANVQTNAYTQLAEQNISITKDITPLVEPVTAGKKNVMFIVKAKGSLNIDTSFVWQKYNAVTGDYENITFVGIGVNDMLGLRIENGYDKSTEEYEAKLWANGITEAAAGTYRCKIVDNMGISKNTASASVEVIPG